MPRIFWAFSYCNEGRSMDKELFEKGLAKRKSVLGAEYVERALAQATDFNRPFQELVTEFAWGFGWGDETLNQSGEIYISDEAIHNRDMGWLLKSDLIVADVNPP